MTADRKIETNDGSPAVAGPIPYKARIVERLRAAYAARQLPTWGDIDDAATEIERLDRSCRALLSTLQWIDSQSDLFFAECSQAEEIIRRAHAALAKAAAPVDDTEEQE